MGSDRQKQLKQEYKEKQVIGGICAVRCSGNGKVWLQSTRSISSLQNRFNFAIAIKSCPDPSMRREWSEFGTESFSFEVLEELKKTPDQTDKQFGEDIAALYELWLEKSGSL